MSEIDVIKELGLGKNEAKIYLSLLKNKDLTVNHIAKKSSVHRVNVYDSIRKLVEKGLVFEVEVAKKKVYRANHPSNLKDLLKEKENKLETILPQLETYYDSTENQARIYEGFEGIKLIINDMLEEKKDILAFGIPKELPEKLGSFLATFHRKRIANKQRILHIYNENATERITFLKELEYSDAKYLPSEYTVPAATLVYGNKTSFWIFSKQPFCVVITSEEMAQTYTKYFNLLWKLAV
ncbi:MAG: TrmB family transcriptional regulator [Candidatus Woesearchaeota archaeon]